MTGLRCHACGNLITFYLHQRLEDGEMRYWHPECCPRSSCPNAVVPITQKQWC